MTLKSRVKHLINKDRLASARIWEGQNESNNRWQQAHAIQQLSADTISRTEELLQRLGSCLRRGNWSGHLREEVGLPEQDSS